jgi:hypothetical protein
MSNKVPRKTSLKTGVSDFVKITLMAIGNFCFIYLAVSHLFGDVP